MTFLLKLQGYESIDEYNPNKKSKLFHEMIADMVSSKKCQQILTYLFITKLNLMQNLTFILLLSYNLILLSQKISD